MPAIAEKPAPRRGFRPTAPAAAPTPAPARSRRTTDLPSRSRAGKRPQPTNPADRDDALLYDLIGAAWAGGGTATYAALGLALAERRRTPEAPDLARRKVAAVLRGWRADERAAVHDDPEGFEDHAEAGAAPQAVWWVNLSPTPLPQATLATILMPLLARTACPVALQQQVRTAVRSALGLSRKCVDSALLAAAAKVPIADVYDLPDRLYRTLVDRGMPAKTAANQRSYLRAAMRWAFTRRLCPAVFPTAAAPSETWTLQGTALFPMGGNRMADLRLGYASLGVSVRETAGDGVLLDDLTMVQARAALRHIRCVRGRLRDCARARAALRFAATRHGRGPYRHGLPSDAFYAQTPAGRVPAIYARFADGRPCTTWASALDVLRKMGLPAETVDALEWHGRYVTLTPTEARRTRAYPTLQNKHRIGPSTLQSRGAHVRALAGAAVHLCGLAPASLAPDVLFGTAFRDVADALDQWWERRAEALRDEGQVRGTAIAGGLHHQVTSGGMIAHSLYERALLAAQVEGPVAAEGRRGQNASRAVRNAGRAAAAATAGGRADVYLRAYLVSCEIGASLKASKGGSDNAGKRGTGDQGSAVLPEFKSIRRIMELTPPAYWLRVLTSMHARVREMIREGRDHGAKFHKLVADAFELGVLMSTGLRGEELIRLTLGHFCRTAGGGWEIRLAAHERKNARPHRARVRTRYLPEDIATTYLDRTRPWLMGGRAAARAEAKIASVARPDATQAQVALLRDRAERARRRGGKNHDYLLVTRGGEAWGDVGLDRPHLTRAERDKALLALAAASSLHGKHWRETMASHIVAASTPDAPMLVPEYDYEFGRHGVRGAMAYAIFLRRGVRAAAHYLGDRENTVTVAYSAVDGVHVDSSDVAEFAGEVAEDAALDPPDADAPSSSRAPAPVAALDAAAQAVLQMLTATLSPEQRAALAGALAA